MNKIPELAASAGSACHSGSTNVSPVLQAMGIRPDIAMGAIRFSLGHDTMKKDIDAAVELLRE